ncbi:biliverdin-producing heme oxygenase [Halomonas alkaliantarctica]|uniref:Biliverdin-producing heme oxygenase n=1 Tax=Halomonas alkaliantarctica TaxID=232346 RepID=A0ABY8LHY8_9GAMM|nr:biliverdin-producing heme oxygenase [Halomonas alkaliantarctica]WGI24076.1 biliverdin-producing heme oxygenase [Halomonas alkaliantarctica]
MSNPTLSEWLKRETRADHRRVDQHPALKPLLKRDLTLPEYATALSALYVPIASLEEALSIGLTALGAHYPLTQRAALLKADMDQLGQHASVPHCASLPKSMASIVGMLYVLEGSRLGGAMIARHVKRVMGDQVPLRFFTTHPLEEAQWADFWHFAEYHCPPPTWPAVLAGAQQAFTLFMQELEMIER